MIKLAIDLGSSVTKIYRADASNGIVLAEPSCVAVSGMEREIKAIGKEAKKLMGKTAEFTEIVFPVYEGEIVDMRLAAAMLKEFLARIGIKSARLKRSETLFSVPCGASEGLKADYAALAEECGLKKIRFAEAPFLAALGADAVLLICTLLDTETIRDYIGICDKLGMSALVETHDAQEMQSAVRAGARLIGVNNRNLKDFTVDLGNAARLREGAPDGADRSTTRKGKTF